MVVGDNESAKKKNAGGLLAILIAVRMPQYDAGHIARYSTSWASLEATGCCHWASARIASPRRLPWSTNSVENTNTNKNWGGNGKDEGETHRLWHGCLMQSDWPGQPEQTYLVGATEHTLTIRGIQTHPNW